jgi:hypothetical protein
MRTFIALALVLGWSAAEAAPSEIRVSESRDDDQITEAFTTLTVDADDAYRAVTDYARWTTIFPDIHQVVVTQQAGVDARVTLVHTAGNRDNIHFRNRPAKRTVWFEDTGGRAEVWAEITFIPGKQAGTTVVHSRIYADVHGVASIFVSNSKLRHLRQERIVNDLTQLRTYFDRELTAVR